MQSFFNLNFSTYLLKQEISDIRKAISRIFKQHMLTGGMLTIKYRIRCWLFYKLDTRKHIKHQFKLIKPNAFFIIKGQLSFTKTTDAKWYLSKESRIHWSNVNLFQFNKDIVLDDYVDNGMVISFQQIEVFPYINFDRKVRKFDIFHIDFVWLLETSCGMQC